MSIANDSAATGRPDSVVPAGARIAVVSGQSVRRFVFCAIAGSSSNTKHAREAVGVRDERRDDDEHRRSSDAGG